MKHVFEWGLCGCWMVQTILDYVRGKKNWEIGWVGGVERDNTKAGGRFPRNGKEVVWRASTLEPSHGQTQFLSHESGASLGTCWPSGDGCVQVRGDLGVMISNWLNTPHNSPSLSSTPHVVTLWAAQWAWQVSPSWISLQHIICMQVTWPPLLAAWSPEPPVSVHCQSPQGVTVSDR